MKKLLSKQETCIKATFVICCLTFWLVIFGCRKGQMTTPTAESRYVFGDLVSNEMQNVVWYDAAGEHSVTNQTTIKDLTSVLPTIKGVPFGFQQKSVIMGVLKYDINSRTNIVNFYIRGLVTVNDASYLIDSKMTGKVLTIIQQSGDPLVHVQP